MGVVFGALFKMKFLNCFSKFKIKNCPYRMHFTIQLFTKMTQQQGRNMVYGLRAQNPKYDWDQGSEEKAQGSEEWDQGSQGF